MRANFKTLKNLNGSQGTDDPKFQIASSTNSHYLILCGTVTKLDFEIHCTRKMLCLYTLRFESMNEWNLWMGECIIRF